MKVKLLVSRAGPTISQLGGTIIEVSSDEGARLIAAGQAEAVKGGASKGGSSSSSKPKKKAE
tara:strand:- start:466 stop:651 length:186 start_codon:yes stop_codon:yes gene_type:complete